jgi:hypothetical protein
VREWGRGRGIQIHHDGQQKVFVETPSPCHAYCFFFPHLCMYGHRMTDREVSGDISSGGGEANTHDVGTSEDKLDGTFIHLHLVHHIRNYLLECMFVSALVVVQERIVVTMRVSRVGGRDRGLYHHIRPATKQHTTACKVPQAVGVKVNNSHN